MNIRDMGLFIFKAENGCSEDLDRIEQYMIWAKSILISIFPCTPLEKATLVIYYHPNTIHSGGIVDCSTMRSDPPNRTIYFLCPSACKNKTAEYYRKNLLHEYTHLFIYREKDPRWFVEGIAEYVAVFHSNDQKILGQYAYYISGIKQQILKSQISFENNMAYSWTTHLIKFLLNEKPLGIQTLLAENEAAFEDDLKRAYGIDLTQMLNLFWDWIGNTFSLDVDSALRAFPLLKELNNNL
jgi:hypothetical protein